MVLADRTCVRGSLGRMRTRLAFWSLGAAVVGTFAVAACVGDDPPAGTSTTIAQGDLDGACFGNGTCNTGLSCNVVDGTAKCTSGTSGDAASTDPPTSGTKDASPSGPASCQFQTTTFPCGDQQPPTACYGATQSCTLTSCNAGELSWECNSARQCGTPCCVSQDVATLAAGINCTEGTLVIAAGAALGATCSSDTVCAAGQTQLCQANSDCPTGQRCTPVKIVGPGAGAALDGTIVAACVP